MYRFEVSQKVRKFVRFFWPLIRGWVRVRDNIRSTRWSEESGSRRIFFRYFGPEIIRHRVLCLALVDIFVFRDYYLSTDSSLRFFSLDKKTSMIERVSKDQVLPNLFHTEVWNATTRLIPYHTLRGKNMMGTGNLDFFLVWEGQLVNS